LQHYDVIVIGGGPGGSTVGTLLADAGRKVLILEKEIFPRYHIGESMLSGTVTILEKLGVLEKMEKAGFLKKYGVSWVWGKDQSLWTVYFKDAVAITHDYGFQVERGPFDKMLLDNAREHGAEALEGHGVTEIIWNEGRAAGIRYAANGGQREARAQWVVDASGQSCLLSNQVTERRWDDRLRNMALWSYWKSAKRPEGIDHGNTFLPAFEDGWWWFIPLRDEITSVGAVLDRNNYERAQSEGLKDYYLKAITRTPQLAERLEGAEMVDAMHVTRDWSYHHDIFCGPGFFLVGDAACFIDPLFSTGVHLAMLSGYLAAVSINTLLSDSGIGEARVQDFFRRQYFAEYARLRDKVYFMYGGHKTSKESIFWNARRIFDLPTPDPKQSFISLIGGAFEHRAWYRRFSRQLHIPEDVQTAAEQAFREQAQISPSDHLAIDGMRLREVND